MYFEIYQKYEISTLLWHPDEDNFIISRQSHQYVSQMTISCWDVTIPSEKNDFSQVTLKWDSPNMKICDHHEGWKIKFFNGFVRSWYVNFFYGQKYFDENFSMIFYLKFDSLHQILGLMFWKYTRNWNRWEKKVRLE